MRVHLMFESGLREPALVFEKDFEGVLARSDMKVTLAKKLLEVERQGDMSLLEPLWEMAVKSTNLMDALWVSAAKGGHLRVVMELVKKNVSARGWSSH